MASDRLREYHARTDREGVPLISWLQLRAGEMWAGDWAACQPCTRHRSMTREPGRKRDDGGFDMGGIAAIRYQRAARFLGPGLFAIAKGVCIDDRPARDFTRERDETDDAAMPILRLALDQLVVFYRPDSPDEKHAGKSGGSAAVDWLEWPEDQQPVVAMALKPRKPAAAVVRCFKCGSSWKYGEPLPECGRAGCRSPGTMIVATEG